MRHPRRKRACGKQRKVRPGHPSDRSAEKHRERAHPHHAAPDRVERGGPLPRDSQPQAGCRAVQPERDAHHRDEREQEHAVLRRDDSYRCGHVGVYRERREPRLGCAKTRARVGIGPVVEHAAHAGARECHADADDDLVRAEPHGEHHHDRLQGDTREPAGEKTEPEAAGGKGCDEGEVAADEQHALKTHVQHAGLLTHGLADGGDQ